MRSGEVLQLLTPMLDVDGGLRAIKFYQDVFDCEEVKERTMLASPIADTGVSPQNDVMGYCKLQFDAAHSASRTAGATNALPAAVSATTSMSACSTPTPPRSK
jgi:hypothetical protein